MAGNLAYRRGLYHEGTVADYLRANGYRVKSSKGSKGSADVWAVKPGQVLFIQVKSGDESPTHDGWNRLFEDAAGYAIPIWADKPARGVLRLRRITGRHVFRSQTWPCVPFVIDEVSEALAL